MCTFLSGHYFYLQQKGIRLILTVSLPTCKEYWGRRRVHVCDRIHFIVAIEIGNGYGNFQDLSLGLATAVILV